VTSVRLPALIGSSNSRLQPVALNAPNRFRCRSQAGIEEDHRYCMGHGAPAAPQPHASSPTHGLSGWASQTHIQPSQRQQIIRACGIAY
jgi:hypothetical protein